MSHRNSLSFSFSPKELKELKTKMLNWLKPFGIFVYLDNNEYNHAPNHYELLVAVNVHQSYTGFPSDIKDWAFGHVSYDYKTSIYPNLKPVNAERGGFEKHFFFVPEIVLSIPYGESNLIIESKNLEPNDILSDILTQPTSISSSSFHQPDWTYSINKNSYMEKVEQLRAQIKQGDFYELNYCIQAKAVHKNLDAFFLFDQLNQLNPSPFAALYKNQDQFLICASPERFLEQSHGTIRSQPIKGTISRGKNHDEEEDQKKKLAADEKERAENVMIVDLVRSDLAKCAQPGSVTVPQLFGVYTFPQLHHLISTVEARILPKITLEEVFKNTFPMGSMTGAPKYIVMERIQEFETQQRGLYSGTIGYITPAGHFDFNVVIRSLIYNQSTGLLTYFTGSAITFDCHPEKEWAELKLKAKAMEQLFSMP